MGVIIFSFKIRFCKVYRHKEKLYKNIIKGIGLYLYNLQH